MSEEKRFELLNMLSFKDNFFDNKNKSNLDSLDVVGILNHYENTLSEFVKRDVEQQNKIADLETKLTVANNLRKNSDEILLNYKTEKYGLDKTIQELRKMKLSLPEKEWYYKGFENCERQMSSHIADLTLEVKELKQKVENAEHERHEEWVTGKEWKWECDRLKYQLAEKDKELARLKLLVDSFDKLKQYDKDADLILINPKTCYTDGKELVVKADNQDKISFAVEQLKNLFKWCCQNHYTEDSLEAHIEEQINKLKEKRK